MNKELKDLAIQSYNGACNVKALILRLAECVEPMTQQEIRECPAVKMVVGQIAYLCGEGIGPSEHAMEAFKNEVGSG